MMIEVDDIFSDTARLNKVFKELYGDSPEVVDQNISRYQALKEKFEKKFGPGSISFFSSPGRTEITGNHTDHNGGKVLTASIDLDTIAAAQKNDKEKIIVHSDGYSEIFSVNLDDLEPKAEKGTKALLRGIAAGMKRKGYNIGGVNAFVTSNVANGSGISSSAAFEMLILQIMNHFFNNGEIKISELAKIGKYAENNYWKKPSGLLDQMACGTGGLITIDFKDPDNPDVTPIKYDFAKEGYKFLVLHTGAEHGNLTPKYAKIPKDMWAIAKELGAEKLCDVKFEDFLGKVASLRKKCGDQAVLRAMHFFTENIRVDEQVSALKNKNFAAFVQLITDSGNSSWRILQNCYDGAMPEQQNIPVALSLTEYFLK
ncbi:MAG: galactokinase, partial [SAR324 cluster bacterium]|nr:galactokinase [SAR324 cluster bacterium]